jgi:hypothetical protein
MPPLRRDACECDPQRTGKRRIPAALAQHPSRLERRLQLNQEQTHGRSDLQGAKRRPEPRMKAVRLTTQGITPAIARTSVTPTGARPLVLAHGETGDNPDAWCIWLPLTRDLKRAARQHITLDGGDEVLALDGLDVRLRRLTEERPPGQTTKRVDKRGQRMFALVPADELMGAEDLRHLVLWSLEPGVGGEATYTTDGMVEVLAEGHEAFGAAGGRPGRAPCPVLLVRGPCRLRWQRGGRITDRENDYTAVYDGAQWRIGPSADMGA